MEKTTLYLPTELAIALRDTSRRTHRTQADIVREALRAYLHGQHRPPLRSLGVVSDPEVSGRESEDWLREHWGRE